MRKGQVVAMADQKRPELELVENDPKQIEAENKVREELRAQLEILKKGMFVHMADITYVQEEGSYIVMKGKIYTDVNGVPLMTDVVLKFTINSISKMLHECRNLLKND